MSRIYLIYRKSGAHADVEKVVTGLSESLGAAAFVHGVQINAASGDTYRVMVENALRETVGAVVVAGPELDSGPDALGRKRLDNPDDSLRIELEAALKISKMMIVIALVGGYELPEAGQLPRSLRPLTRRGVIRMGAVESFEADGSYLESAVRRMLNGSARRAIRNVTVLFLIIMLVLIVFMVVATVQMNTASTLVR